MSQNDLNPQFAEMMDGLDISLPGAPDVDDVKIQTVNSVSEALQYRVLMKTTGPSVTISAKFSDWLADAFGIVVENSQTPWKSRADFVRDAVYYLLCAYQQQVDSQDPKLLQALAKAQVTAGLDAAETEIATLHDSAVALKRLLDLRLKAGEEEDAQRDLVAFWKSVEGLPEPLRRKYEFLFHSVPAIQLIAYTCEGRLPSRLIPEEDELELIKDVDTGGDRGLPWMLEKTDDPQIVISPPPASRKDYIREYMREYRKRKRGSEPVTEGDE